MFLGPQGQTLSSIPLPKKGLITPSNGSKSSLKKDLCNRTFRHFILGVFARCPVGPGPLRSPRSTKRTSQVMHLLLAMYCISANWAMVIPNHQHKNPCLTLPAGVLGASEHEMLLHTLRPLHSSKGKWCKSGRLETTGMAQQVQELVEFNLVVMVLVHVSDQTVNPPGTRRAKDGFRRVSPRPQRRERRVCRYALSFPVRKKGAS